MFLLSRILIRSLMKMAANNAVLNRLEQKGAEADQIIEYLKQQVALLKEKAMILMRVRPLTVLQASLREEKKLRVENAKLKKEIEVLKQELIQAEIRNGVKQISMPPSDMAAAVSFSKDFSQTSSAEALSGPKEQIKGPSEEKKKKDKTEKKGEKKEKKQSAANDDSKPLDMQNRMAIFLCNLKPVKMRGVVSQAMLMCASTPEKVEIIIPPNRVVPGEKITFEGFSGEPEKELNPKKKIWEQIQPDLQTNEQCIATYKGVPFEVKGKGVCRAPSMANSGIK
ncbi:hypothetical protein Chor_001107 [Crotalus horridus]